MKTINSTLTTHGCDIASDVLYNRQHADQDK